MSTAMIAALEIIDKRSRFLELSISSVLVASKVGMNKYREEFGCNTNRGEMLPEL